MLMVSASQYQPGGGLVVYNGSTAMLTDVNVYSNTVSSNVCLPCCPREKPCYIHPLELTSVARMLNFGVAECECFAFEN